MAGRIRSSNVDEILLQRNSPCLNEISRYFSTIDEVIGLATYLLQDLPTGGRSFVNSLPASSSVPDKAHAVLDEWCRMCPRQAYGQRLYEVLKITNINPVAAEKFKAKLVSSNPDVSSVSKKRKSKDVHSDEEGQPKKTARRSSAAMSNLPSAILVSSEDSKWEEKMKEKLSEIRSPLFLELASLNWPFCGVWRDIFKWLPDVKKESRSGYVSSSRYRPCAYPNPSPEIKRIRDIVRDRGSQSIDGDCLQMALNGWVDYNGGKATVADLLYVLELVKLGGAAQRFFHQYFNLPDA